MPLQQITTSPLYISSSDLVKTSHAKDRTGRKAKILQAKVMQLKTQYLSSSSHLAGGLLLESLRLHRLRTEARCSFPSVKATSPAAVPLPTAAARNGLLHIFDHLQDDSRGGEGARHGLGNRICFLNARTPGVGFPRLGKGRIKDPYIQQSK
jgi:hypothetical protein